MALSDDEDAPTDDSDDQTGGQQEYSAASPSIPALSPIDIPEDCATYLNFIIPDEYMNHDDNTCNAIEIHNKFGAEKWPTVCEYASFVLRLVQCHLGT